MIKLWKFICESLLSNFWDIGRQNRPLSICRKITLKIRPDFHRSLATGLCSTPRRVRESSADSFPEQQLGLEPSWISKTAYCKKSWWCNSALKMYYFPLNRRTPLPPFRMMSPTGGMAHSCMEVMNKLVLSCAASKMEKWKFQIKMVCFQ